MYKKVAFALLAGAFLLVIAPRAITLAQPPADTPELAEIALPEITLPENFQPKPIQAANKSLQSAIQSKIRKALHEDGPIETGDAVLDDMLKVLKKRGSVLEGSALKATDPSVQPTRLRSTEDKRARAAESLLKASRLLRELGESSPQQIDLIQQMRRESVRLLQPVTESEPNG